MSKIKDFLRNTQRWSSITALYKRRLRFQEATKHQFLVCTDQIRFSQVQISGLILLFWNTQIILERPILFGRVQTVLDNKSFWTGSNSGQVPRRAS